MSRNPNVTILTTEQYKIAESNGIKRCTACARVRNHGWDIERAISEPARTWGTVTFTDKERQIMRRKGIKIQTAKDRIMRYGWDRERATTEETPYRILY